MQPCSFRGSWACSWSLCGEYYIRFASSRASDAELLTLYGFFSFRKAAIVEDEKEVAVAARTPACATTGRAGALATRATRVLPETAGAHCFVLNAQSINASSATRIPGHLFISVVCVPDITSSSRRYQGLSAAQHQCKLLRMMVSAMHCKS